MTKDGVRPVNGNLRAGGKIPAPRDGVSVSPRVSTDEGDLAGVRDLDPDRLLLPQADDAANVDRLPLVLFPQPGQVELVCLRDVRGEEGREVVLAGVIGER